MACPHGSQPVSMSPQHGHQTDHIGKHQACLGKFATCGRLPAAESRQGHADAAFDSVAFLRQLGSFHVDAVEIAPDSQSLLLDLRGSGIASRQLRLRPTPAILG